MKKYTIYILTLLLGVNFSVTAANIVLAGVDYNLDTLESFQVGPGTTYSAIQMKRSSDKGGRLDAYILQVDSRNPYISFSQVLGKDAVIGTERPSAMAERKTTDRAIYFAGTNGDFFLTQGDVGTPIGLTVGGSQYARIGTNAHRFGAIDEDNTPVLGNVWNYQGTLLYGDKELNIHHVNYTRMENELVLYNQHNGASTLTNAAGTEVLVELLPGERWQTSGNMKLKVLEKQRNVGNMTIPEGKAVLSGHGTMAAELDGLESGDEVLVQFDLTVDGELKKLAECIGGDNYALIIDKGVVVKKNFWNENHPRTGFGASLTGDTVVFCVVDGRGQSVGCTSQVLGGIMQYYGAWKAVNWDGGGSSGMYIKHFGQVNNGSDGTERAVANAMFAVANVPDIDNTIAEIQAYARSLRLPKYGIHVPAFLGYNKYGILLDKDVRNVVLSCDETTGYIDELGRFVCIGSGVLKASYNGIECDVRIQLAEDVPFAIRLDSVLVSDDTDYTIEVTAVVGKNTMLLQPAALTWTVQDENICTVSAEGVLNGLTNGTTWIYGTLDNLTDSLLVHVEIPETKPLLWNTATDGSAWTVTETGDWQTTLQADGQGKMTLGMTYNQGGRLPYTSLEPKKEQTKLYSLPESLEVRINPQSAPLKEVHIGLLANNSRESVNYKFTDFVAHTDTALTIDLVQALNTQDIAAFPIMLSYLTFYWDSKIKAGDCTLDINGIWLHYGEISLGVESVSNPAFTVYPNPAGDVLYVNGCEVGAMALFYDLQGRVVLSEPLTETGTIDLSRLEKGNWLLRINDTAVKVIKQ